ncbi:hypothetical protein [Nocardiopsis sp. CC223A]|uniref:hypothetical protein n=1 Tax=Nocardiopsis sp. CC223A TaxID=3044051 RepID=UPI00278BC6E2|nr:hypothetical protein [Nocardiopsis sp. CC223A]
MTSGRSGRTGNQCDHPGCNREQKGTSIDWSREGWDDKDGDKSIGHYCGLHLASRKSKGGAKRGTRKVGGNPTSGSGRTRRGGGGARGADDGGLYLRLSNAVAEVRRLVESNPSAAIARCDRMLQESAHAEKSGNDDLLDLRKELKRLRKRAVGIRDQAPPGSFGGVKGARASAERRKVDAGIARLTEELEHVRRIVRSDPRRAVEICNQVLGRDFWVWMRKEPVTGKTFGDLFRELRRRARQEGGKQKGGRRSTGRGKR